MRITAKVAIAVRPDGTWSALGRGRVTAGSPNGLIEIGGIEERLLDDAPPGTTIHWKTVTIPGVA